MSKQTKGTVGITPLAAANWTNDANEYYTDLANIIATALPVSTIEAASWRHDLMAFLMKGQMPNGGGFLYVFPVNTIPGEDVDFDNGNSQLKIFRPDVKEVPIKIQKYRRYSITNNTDIARTAFDNDQTVNYLLNILWGLPEQEALIDWSEYGLNLLDKSNCTKIDYPMPATSSGADGVADNFTNNIGLCKAISKACDDITVKSAKYTNKTTMTERRPDELTFIFNKKYMYELMLSLLAPLFHGEIALEMTRITQSVLLPEAACTQPDLIKDPTGATPKYPTLAKMICLVTAWERFNLFYTYTDTGVFRLTSIGSETMTRIVGGGWGEVDDFYAVMFLDQ